MYLDVFKVFCDLAETGSFSKAALLNGVTQSAVSQQVRAVENKFQVVLVDRGRRSFALTPEGRAFLQASRELLEIYQGLSDRMHALRDVIAGELKIASIYSVGLHELPPRLKAFREKFPEVEVHVEYRRSQQVYTQVLEGEVDLGLVAYPVKRTGLAVEIFSADELVVICHPNHPLAGEKTISLQRLAGEKFIAFEPDVPTRKVIDRHLRDHAVEIEHVMEFDNIETVKRAVEVESGLSIVPRNTVRQEVESGLLFAVELSGPKLSRPLGVITRRNRPRSSAQKEFVATLRAGFPR
ncbi:MAG TPA: LysR family transcriptional regulator [Chthoniobacteraceae bacterium]|jgi:DNA-binding transcriptional LysR family regulator